MDESRPKLATLPDRLRWLRTRKGFRSARQTADNFGWPVSTYTQHENGKRNPRTDEIQKYAAAFDVAWQWLQVGDRDDELRPNEPPDPPAHRDLGPQNVRMLPYNPAQPPMLRDLPVRGRARGGDTGIMIIDSEPIEWTWRPPQLVGVPDAFAIDVDGDSCKDFGMPHGATAFVLPRKPPRKGDLALVETTDGEAYLKRYISTTSDTVHLEQSNPPKKIDIQRNRVKQLFLIKGAWYNN